MFIHAFDRPGTRLAGLLVAAPLLALVSVGTAHAAICRVTPAGVSSGAGTWASPMDLQTALANAMCTEIWVTSGVYTPVVPLNPENVTDGERAVSFDIKPDVAVYGGFIGTESTRGERAPDANLTILSGDIDGNDLNTDGNEINETWTDTVGSNSYHIVFMNGTPAAGTITAGTVLDGFTVTGGNATGTLPDDRGAGLYCNGEGTGNECSPTLSSLNFTGNYAGYLGGAIFNAGNNGGASNPALTNVTFSGNTAVNSGGAMYNFGSFGTCSPSLANVTFSGNEAYNGGAMYNNGYSGVSSPSLTNVTFHANRANFTGGAIYNNGSSSGVSSPALRNVILWGDTAGSNGPEIYNDEATPVIAYSVIQGSGGSGAGWDLALGTDGGGNLDADPDLGSLGNHGGSTATMVPGVGSSAIDTGTCIGALAFDQRGMARPQGAACDIGAVEYRGDLIFANGFD